MATAAQPDPTQVAAPDAAQPADQSAAPSQAPASPNQIKLAQLYQICKLLAQQDPTLAPGLSKAAQGIQEAQTALVQAPQPQPTGATPPQ
jgi:hypothetical protein